MKVPQRRSQISQLQAIDRSGFEGVAEQVIRGELPHANGNINQRGRQRLRWIKT